MAAAPSYARAVTRSPSAGGALSRQFEQSASCWGAVVEAQLHPAGQGPDWSRAAAGNWRPRSWSSDKAEELRPAQQSIPGTWFPVIPTVCVSCGGSVVDAVGPNSELGICPVCAMPVISSPRRVDVTEYWDPPAADIPTVRVSGVVDGPLPRVPIQADAEAHDLLRTHPRNPALVVAYSFHLPVAVLPKRYAAYLRVRYWRQRVSWLSCREGRPLQEAEWMAYVVAGCRAGAVFPAMPLSHWMMGEDWAFPCSRAVAEPSRFRAARWPTGLSGAAPVPVLDPARSPFCDVERDSTLQWQAYTDVVRDHPVGGWLLNSILFGFPCLADVPMTGRTSRDALEGARSPEARAALQATFDKEVKRGFIRAWPSWLPSTRARVCPYFGVPKGDGSLRGIVDCSAGVDSLNAHTHREGHWPMRLATIGRLMDRINYMHKRYPGEQLLAIKLDAEKAFRQLAVPENQRGWLAVRCDGKLYYNATLAMGASASPQNQSHALYALSDFLAHWFDVFSMVYVDDWIQVMRGCEAEWLSAITHSAWDLTGWLQAPDKREQFGTPAPVIEYLGVLVDLPRRVVAITPARAAKLVALLGRWLDGSMVRTPQAYSSLAGKLRHISSVVPWGTAFTSSLFRFTTWAPNPVAESGMLAPDVLLDLLWWRKVLSTERPEVHFDDKFPAEVVEGWSDACEYMGGAYCPAVREYMQVEWTPEELAGLALVADPVSIAQKEMAMVLLEVATWGHVAAQPGASGVYRVWCDNLGDVMGAQAQSFKDLRLRLMLRLLCVIQMHARVTVIYQHIPGVVNVHSDHLSRVRGAPPAALARAQYSRRDPHPLMRSLVSELLSTWHRPQDMAVGLTVPLFERFYSTVMTCVTPSPRPLRWTAWSPAASMATVHTGVC